MAQETHLSPDYMRMQMEVWALYEQGARILDLSPDVVKAQAMRDFGLKKLVISADEARAVNFDSRHYLLEPDQKRFGVVAQFEFV